VGERGQRGGSRFVGAMYFLLLFQDCGVSKDKYFCCHIVVEIQQRPISIFRHSLLGTPLHVNDNHRRDRRLCCNSSSQESTGKVQVHSTNSATYCNTLQHTATQCNTLRHTATHCNTLRHTATHCNTLHHTASHCNTLQRIASHCITLQHTATHCDTATHCNTLHRGPY